MAEAPQTRSQSVSLHENSPFEVNQNSPNPFANQRPTAEPNIHEVLLARVSADIIHFHDLGKRR